MKGMVFTEFIEFVEDKFGFETSDKIINEANLPSGGVYTSVGTYEFSEMVQLLVNLSKEVNTPIHYLLENYGIHLFFRFGELYPVFLEKSDSLFDFISKIDQYIHIEVQKLYPDAELPSITMKLLTDQKIEMIYSSERKLSHFALGLLKGAAKYFKEPVEIEMDNIEPDGSKVMFKIEKI